ncbi:YaiO family outer membrane beta-barrel protein [Undibacterium sp. Ji67W]|uniref:YaiO family outer membrane beta-barrel protein n=1 Tax=Undibacterium sp. Ji67W TaxID=3413042 RepID=UPI003BEFC5E4
MNDHNIKLAKTRSKSPEKKAANRIAVALLSIGILNCQTGGAQEQNRGIADDGNIPVLLTPGLESQPFRSIEISVGDQHLTNDYGDWRDISINGVYTLGQQIFQLELASKREFNTAGNFLGLADTVTINDDWYTRISAGSGDGAFYLPRYRADLFLYKKWLEHRNFVSSFGVGYYSSPDGHIDRNVNIGGVYYFESPWIVQLGLRYNWSNPGKVETHQQLIAITYGRDKHDQITLRSGWGGEAYQQISTQNAIVNFQSREVSVLWHHWLTPVSGFMLSAERYSNPLYERMGGRIGYFQQF